MLPQYWMKLYSELIITDTKESQSKGFLNPQKALKTKIYAT